MTKRERWSVLVCLALLTIGTIVALTFVNNQRAEDRRINERTNEAVRRTEEAIRQECLYARENRQIIVQVLTDLSRGSFLDAASQQRLREEAALVEGRANELHCD